MLLLGNFNLPSLRWASEEIEPIYVTPLDQSFYDLFLILGLTQVVHDATFPSSGNILDLVLTSEVESTGEVYILSPLPNCHHCPVVVELFVDLPSSGQRSIRLWFKGNYSLVNQELYGVDWESEFEGRSANSCYERLLVILDSLVERCVPLIDVASKPPRWMNSPPAALMRARSGAWSNFKRLRRSMGRSHVSAQSAWDRYAQLNSEYRSYSKRKQWEYEAELAKSLSSAPKLFHAYIRRRKKGRPPIGPLKVDNLVVSEPELMAEVFANGFCSVYDETVAPSTDFDQQFSGSMEPLTLSYDIIFELLMKLDSSSSPGPDGIHPHLLKACAHSLAYPLLVVFSRSLRSGCLPEIWKHSIVVPLFKAGSRSNSLNYRPVSLTSMCCKVMVSKCWRLIQ